MTTKTNELPKNLQRFVAAFAILANWDESIGGKRPVESNIADAVALVTKPGKPGVLNQGVRALCLALRAEGSTDGQRQYASMSGAPHNNVGKCGDALRAQYGSSRLEVGKDYPLTLPGGRVVATSNKAGHIHLTVTERFAAPIAEAPKTDKPKAKRTRKPKAVNAEAAPATLADNAEAAPATLADNAEAAHIDDLSDANMDELERLTDPSAPSIGE